MPIRSTRRLAVAAALLALSPAPALRAQAAGGAADIDIPFQKYTLPNGLTLIVHEDHKAPIVAVNVWYHVGSKNERPGKTGFAHLYEHLMFNGSLHHPGDYFPPFERVGATDMNGTTNPDRTNYFETVPTSALDLALWMESDRMAYTAEAITQQVLDEQRGVVQNEKRQGDNQPYGKVEYIIAQSTYPAGHPYSWTTIGSMEDLNAASLEDVKQWFRDYYGAANAVLVVAGDVKAEEVHQKVLHYFGEVPPGPPIQKQQAWPAKMTGTHRATMQDRVPLARLYKVWNMPQYGDADADYLDLVSDVLGSGKTSRLYRRLVYRDRIATDARAFVNPGEIGGQFYIQVTARPGADLAQIEKAVDEELAAFLEKGPTPAEVEQVRTRYRANFIRGIERIGGFGGKSDVLAQSMVYGGRPDFYKVKLQRVAAMTPADLQGAAKRWLSDGQFVLTVTPYPQLAATPSNVDRSRLPDVAQPARASFATMENATLSNGLKVILARRTAVPVVRFNLLLDAGFAADQFGKPGTAALAMNMLDEGTTSRDALQISDQLAALGASLTTGSDLDASSVSLNTLTDKLDPALEIFADVVLHPSFPQSEFERLKQEQLAAIQREKATPVQMALRVFPKLLYGAGHAYGNPLTGSGTEASVQAITRDDLVRFHQTWFKPNHATLVVVGDITMDALRPKLEKLFGAWKPGDVPTKNLARVQEPAAPAIYLVDRPGSDQSIIFAGNIAPPQANPQEAAIETLNDILGGSFGSRVNMNLREDKHWSYGAFTLVWSARGQRPFIAYAPVQTDKTTESVQELAKELKGILGPRPITPEEIDKAKRNLTLSLPGRWETGGAVAGDIGTIVRYGLSPDYFQTYADRINAVTPAQLAEAARTLVHPDHMVWVVVGDRQKIEAGLRSLNLGPIRLIDADGNPVGPKA
ncbi:MAG: insulinase family protein [Gemmatimonadetes bacterium]|nr:insulinase family protein [Gemmatimonadota bacterium]